MDATCTIQDSIHVFNLVHKYVSRILGTYHVCRGFSILYAVRPFKKITSSPARHTRRPSCRR